MQDPAGIVYYWSPTLLTAAEAEQVIAYMLFRHINVSACPCEMCKKNVENVDGDVPETPKKTLEVVRSRMLAGVRAEPEKPKVGRNAPCPCMSGKKFKRCCGKNAP
jgi:uncharacterized protein YecA (UPF0149 family)